MSANRDNLILVNGSPYSHTIWPGGVGLSTLMPTNDPAERKKSHCLKRWKSRGRALSRCPTPAVVVKVTITINGAPTSSKGIWKLIFKNTFQMLLELVGAQETNDIRSQLRHFNRRVESNSEFERGQIWCFWFDSIWILASLSLPGCPNTCNAL